MTSQSYPDLSRNAFFTISSLLLAFVTCVGAIFGQADQTNSRNISADANDSGDLTLNVPLGSYKGRGLDLPVFLNYSSDVWTIKHLGTVHDGGVGGAIRKSVTQAIYAETSTAGWRTTLALPTIDFSDAGKTYDHQGKEGSGGGTCTFFVREVKIHMPDGSIHTLRKSDQPSNAFFVDKSGTFYAVDNSRIRFDANGTSDTGTIYMPDGTRYVLGHPTSQIIDRNGNTLTYDESTRQWTDTLNRPIVNPIPANPQAQDYPYSLPGLAGVNGGTQNYVFKWRNLANVLTPDANNQTPALRVIGSEYLPNPSLAPSDASNCPVTQSSQYPRLFQSVIPEGDPDNPDSITVATLVVGHLQAGGVLFNPVVLAEIDLPDGTSYKFTYNEYGEVTKVVYPTNSFDQYSYYGAPATPGACCGGDQQPYVQSLRSLRSRKQSVDGLGDDFREWQYDIQKGLDGGGSSTITSPDGTKTVTTLYGPGPKATGTSGPGGQTLVFFYPYGFRDARVGMPATKKFYASAANGGGLLRFEVYDYEETTNNYPIVCDQSPDQPSGGVNRLQSLTHTPRLMRTTNIIFEGTGSALAQSMTYQYDLTNEFTTGIDQTQGNTYNYIVVDNTTAQGGDLTLIGLGTLAKYSVTSYLNGSPYQGNNILGLPTSVEIHDSSGTIVSRSEMSYDDSGYVASGTTNALPSTMKTWDSTKGAYTSSGAYLVTHATFDQYGNRTVAMDAMGNSTTTTYDSTYHAFPISVTSPVPDSTGVHGSNSAFTSSTSFDTTTGLVLSATDANGQTTTMEYNDPLLRPTKVTAPNGQQTITEYGAGTSEATRWVKVKTQIDAYNWSQAQSFYDGIGRTYKTQKTDSNGDIFGLTCYDQMGRVAKTSNPFRNYTNQSCSTTTGMDWTTPAYDDLGRTTTVTSPDGSSVSTAYALSTTGVIGTVKTITDQAGRSRQGIADALGNMVRVIEDPASSALTTDYVFDTLGNLRKTTQGEQVRYFNYDSLGRVLRAKQVEQDTNGSLALSTADPITGNNSWTVGYTYDDNGNIATTTNAKNQMITATYDHLNRLTVRDYSDSATPDVNFYYDGKYQDENGTWQTATGSVKGKTTEVDSSVSRTINTAFDTSGRLVNNKQITDGQAYPFIYTYNLSGALIEETYPSTRVVKSTVDVDGQLSQVESKKDANHGFVNYADGFAYNAAGAVTKMQLGNGHWETSVYNNRLQVTQIGLGTTDTTVNPSLLTLGFKYNTPSQNDNNGSMREQDITVPMVGSNPTFTAVQSYAYDSLNRIQSATETVSASQTWKQTFSYDRYGNRRFDTTGSNTTTIPGGCSTAVCNPTISTANNRFSSGQSYSYDADGSVTQDATGQRFGYDNEDRQKEFYLAPNSGSTPDGTYSYDGSGQRVKKVTASETTVFVYDASGQLAAEYSTQISQTPQVSYLTTDHLGSPRIITNENGAVTSRKDFTAFGEDVVSSQRTSGTGGNGYDPPNVRQDYTGYQSDEESGLEYSMARYYNSSHGRFTSADPLPASAAIKNPQTFNRYSYVQNSPYKFTDPLGLFPAGGGACGRNRCVHLESSDDGNFDQPQHAAANSYDWILEDIVQDPGAGILPESYDPQPPPSPNNDGTIDASDVTPTVGSYGENSVNNGTATAVFDTDLAQNATSVEATVEQNSVAYEKNKNNAFEDTKAFNDAVDALSSFEIQDFTTDIDPFGPGRYYGSVAPNGMVNVPESFTGGALGISIGIISGSGNTTTINNPGAASAAKANQQISLLNEMKSQTSVYRTAFVAANKDKFITITVNGANIGRERLGADNAAIVYNNAVNSGIAAANAQLRKR